MILLRLRGKKAEQESDYPSEDFPVSDYNFVIGDLVNSALNSRAELLVAIKNREVSEKNLRLLRAERAFEFSIEAGYSYNSIVRNDIAPAPAHNSVSAGLSLPLKLSSLNRGSVRAAQLEIEKTNKEYEDAELQIYSEVLQAYNSFSAQARRVEQYNRGLIEDAGKILQGRIYSYQNGESGLVDVLNAQRTYMELQLDYIDALFEYTVSLIEVQRSAGIWDITSVK